MAIIYLFRRGGINLPTLYRARGEPVLNEQPSNGTICGISACKVYPLQPLLAASVVSYATFSPLSRRGGTVIFCGTFSYHSIAAATALLITGCIALCCPDFPPSRHWRKSDSLACSPANVLLLILEVNYGSAISIIRFILVHKGFYLVLHPEDGVNLIP